MNHHRLPALACSLTNLPSRRDVLHGLAGMGLAFGVASLPDAAEAKKKRKRKKKDKKPKPNAFDCLSVGKTCMNADQCCSGICEGKKGKRKCRAHGAGTCEQDVAAICQSGTPITTSCNNRADCACFRTTAGSSFCAELFCGEEGCSECADCQRDADCVALGFPPEAACAPVSAGACAGICDGGMACMLPCGVELPEPPAP
jgi:hypothetical protein